MSKTYKVALVVGHTITKGGDRGAYSETLKVTENEYWLDVANKVLNLSKGSKVQIVVVNLFTHTIQSYYDRQKALAARLNKENYDLVLETHFNAASALANGTECLYYFASKKGKEIAAKLSSYTVMEFGTTKRGDNGTRALANKSDRGYHFVYMPKAPAIIYEPFFGSNSADSEKFRDRDKVAKFLFEALSKIL